MPRRFWSCTLAALLLAGCNCAPDSWSFPFTSMVRCREVRPEPAVHGHPNEKKPPRSATGSETADDDDDDNFAFEVFSLVAVSITGGALAVAADLVLLPVTLPHDLLLRSPEPAAATPTGPPPFGSTLIGPLTLEEQAKVDVAQRLSQPRRDWTRSVRLLLGGSWLADETPVTTSDQGAAELGLLTMPKSSPWGFEAGLGYSAKSKRYEPGAQKVSNSFADFTVGCRYTHDFGLLRPYAAVGLGVSQVETRIERVLNPLHDHDLVGIGYVRVGFEFAPSPTGWSLGVDVRQTFGEEADLFEFDTDTSRTRYCVVISKAW